MSSQDVSFDPAVFARTASRFAVKRDCFASETVAALAADVIRRLATVTARHARDDAPAISAESLAAFCDVLIEPEPGAAMRFIRDRRAEGLTRQDVYLGYIGAAARRLGEGWDEDRLSILDVTIGTGHLYALMRALRAERPAAPMAFNARRCALFATVPGEDHGIGITIAADLFREAGWDIDLRIGTEHDSLVAHVERTAPQIIGMSLSSEGRLEALVRLVVALRLVAPEAIVGVAPWHGLDAQRLHDLVDIDLVFGDARSARVELDRLVRLHG
ncbi:MAG: B12-binding domain-containing protein [Gemmobacter sp.]